MPLLILVLLYSLLGQNPLMYYCSGSLDITFDIPKHFSLHSVSSHLKRAVAIAAFIKESLTGIIYFSHALLLVTIFIFSFCFLLHFSLPVS